LPEYIIYKGSGSGNMRENWVQDGPSGCRFNISESGWMERPIFLDWFRTIFVPYTEQIGGNKLLIFDGHASHIGAELINLAREKSTTLLCLPSHTSHFLQPLDLACYSPIKACWRELVKNQYQAGNKNINKLLFPKLLSQIHDKCLTRSNAVAGFEKAGIYPFNPAKVESKTATKMSRQWTDLKSIQQQKINDDDDDDDELPDLSRNDDDDHLDELDQANLLDQDDLPKTSRDAYPLRNITNITNNIKMSNSTATNTVIAAGETVVTYLTEKAKNFTQPAPKKCTKGAKRSYAESLTSDDVAERINQKEEAEKRKKEETEEKKKKKLLIN